MPDISPLMPMHQDPLLVYSCGEITYWRGPGTQERRRESTGRSLTKWHEYLLTLVRIRLGIDLELVGFLFGIHFSTASRIFITWVNLLHGTLKHDLKWPDRASVQAYMPQDFKLRYPKTRVIIDCTEFETQRPKNTKNQARTYSQYKGRNTCKALVGINPNGAFTFVSDVWSGNIYRTARSPSTRDFSISLKRVTKWWQTGASQSGICSLNAMQHSTSRHSQRPVLKGERAVNSVANKFLRQGPLHHCGYMLREPSDGWNHLNCCQMLLMHQWGIYWTRLSS